MFNSSLKSSAIDSIVYDDTNQQLNIIFSSNPNKVYIYGTNEEKYEFVKESFNNTDSLGRTYHQLLQNNTIFSIK
jgi:hypothetical protein